MERNNKIYSHNLTYKFFKKKKELIRAVYLTNSDFNHLHYYIVLKVDNMENRMNIFSFLDKNDELFCPIYFQFVPKHLENKFNNSFKILY